MASKERYMHVGCCWYRTRRAGDRFTVAHPAPPLAFALGIQHTDTHLLETRLANGINFSKVECDVFSLSRGREMRQL